MIAPPRFLISSSCALALFALLAPTTGRAQTYPAQPQITSEQDADVGQTDAGAQAFVGGAPATESPSLALWDAGALESPAFHTTVTSVQSDPALIGSSATTVTRDQIEAMPGGDNRSIAEIVTTLPGTVMDSFGSNIHVRGADGAILYVLDGIPMFTPALGTIGQLINTLPTRLVQNVQFYTGGFPVEYSYALGGIVDIQTRRPTIDPTAEAQITYGSYNLTDVALNYSQAIGKLSVVASADFVSTDRGLDTPDAITVLHDYRIGGNGFAKLDYEVDSRNKLVLIATYEEDKFQVPIDPTMLPLSDAPPGAIRGNDIYGNSPPPFVPYDADPTDLERTIFAALSYVHTGAEVTTQISAFVREIYEDFDCDPVGSLGATADPGSVCSSYTRDAFHFGGLGNATWHWLPGNTWRAGVELRDQESNLNFQVFTRDDNSPSGGPDPSLTISGGDNINTLSGGAYVEDRIEVDKFTFMPGVRFDMQNTNFGTSAEPNLLLSGPSARLGASYAPSDKVLFHAFAGYLWEAPVNFDAPVVAQIITPSLGGPQPVDLKPARTLTAELGISVHPKRKVTLGLTGWGRITYDMLDHQNIGNSDLWASFNWNEGRAAGFDLFGNGQILKFGDDHFILDGFGNLSAQDAEQLGINSELFLFSPLTLQQSQTWTTMDHVQNWTANVGLTLHDTDKRNNVMVRFNYGSGFHTGIVTDEEVPEHATIDVTASHTFDLPGQPALAFDAFNLFNDIYAYRLGTGFFGNSQYAPLRRFDLRLIVHFG